jgi:hypothetical protein
MFRKLDLFPSSGDGGHLLCWVLYEELTSITGTKSKNPVILSVTYHRQNSVESMLKNTGQNLFRRMRSVTACHYLRTKGSNP